MEIRSSLAIFKQAARDWWNDGALRLSASLAFYTALSLAPVMVIVVNLAGLIFDKARVRGRIVHEIEALAGEQAAGGVQEVLNHLAEPSGGAFAMTFGVIALLVGATAVFGELQTALNLVWDVQPKPIKGWSASLRNWLKARFLSLAMVVTIAFLLLVSLLLSAGLSAALDALRGSGRETGAAMLGSVVDLLFAMPIITLLFALLFKYVPDAKIQWRDVWVGAFFSATLFTLGKYGIGVYVGHTGIGSVYGAASSLMLLLVWVYYSALIVFFGAEFTQAYANRRHPIRAKSHAQRGAAVRS